MKKVALLASLTCVVVALCVSYLTLSLHWSVISKVILLMLSSFVCLSVALLAILGWLDTLSTTSSRAGLNRLASLKAAESRIARGKTKTSSPQYFWIDEWEELNEQDRRNNAEKT